MEAITNLYGRKLAKLLDRLVDSPLEVIWDQTEREAIPLVELVIEGQVYRPRRSEKIDKREPAKWLDAESFTAKPAVLAPLFRENKISVEPPHCDCGRLLATRERCFRPWRPPEGVAPEPFEELLVKCKLLRSISVIPWLKPPLRPGEIFGLPFSQVRGIGFTLLPNVALAPLQILE